MDKTRSKVIALALLLLGAPALAGSGLFQAASSVLLTAEIEIGLPASGGSHVTVAGDDERVTVDIPDGSTYPPDFVSASGGFVEAGELERLEDGRVRVTLRLGYGYLERTEYRRNSVVLRFQSRRALAQTAPITADEYSLGPGDRVSITVHNHPELTSKLTVNEAGTITAPLVGEVEVAGSTVRDLGTRLAELLDRTYLVTPQVDVQVDEYRSQWAMIDGEVRKPGRVPLRGGTDLKEALTEAGGFGDDAGEEIVISRRVNGAVQQAITVERADFENGAANPILRHGDIVTVKRATYCYIQGEVQKPMRVPIERGMTLLKAITIAGGLTQWANLKSVRVLREGDDGTAEEYNLKAIRNGRRADPELKGGEIVIVRRRSL